MVLPFQEGSHETAEGRDTAERSRPHGPPESASAGDATAPQQKEPPRAGASTQTDLPSHPSVSSLHFTSNFSIKRGKPVWSTEILCTYLRMNFKPPIFKDRV